MRVSPPKAAYEDLINAYFGEGVAERLIRGFEKVEEATNLLDANAPQLVRIAPTMALDFYQGEVVKDVPAWLTKAKDLYTQATDEMYRANQRARKVAHEPIFYHAKRYEFALSYLSSLESLRLAALARQKKTTDEQLKHLESAAETLFNGLSALGEVAWDASNLGALAALNAYAYKPVKAELERVEKAGKK